MADTETDWGLFPSPFSNYLNCVLVDEHDQEITLNPIKQLLGEPVSNETWAEPSHLNKGAPNPKLQGWLNLLADTGGILSILGYWEIMEFSNSSVFYSALLCQGNPERHFSLSSCLWLLPPTTFSTEGVVWPLALSRAKEIFDKRRTCCSTL